MTKNQNVGLIVTFGGAVRMTVVYWWWPNLVNYSRHILHLLVTLHLNQFIHPLWAKTPNFTVLSTSAFCGVTSWRQSDKVEHEYVTKILPHVMEIPSLFIKSSIFHFWPQDRGEPQRGPGKALSWGPIAISFWLKHPANFRLGNPTFFPRGGGAK